MILTPDQFLEHRFEFIKDYPDAPFNVGDIISAYEHDGNLYLAAQGAIKPSQFPDNFRKLRWHDHRTLEQLLSIKYMKIVGDKSSYYIPGDIVPVIGMTYNNPSLVGGEDDILYNLKGHYFSVYQLEPATKQEHDDFWDKNKK